MKNYRLFQIVFAVVISGAAFISAHAQEQLDAESGPRTAQRVNLLSELNLSNAQIRQIRDIRRERQSALRAARERLQNANRLLDEAVYADNFNEADVSNRLREAQSAQAALIEHRISTEAEIRRVLFPAQLVRFREIRARFGNRAVNRRNGNQNRRRNLPLRQLNRRPRSPQ